MGFRWCPLPFSRQGNPPRGARPHLRVVERLDGEIERIRRVARPLEERPGPRGPQGLVTELVAGNEEDGSRSPQRDARCHRDCTATVAPVCPLPECYTSGHPGGLA